MCHGLATVVLVAAAAAGPVFAEGRPGYGSIVDVGLDGEPARLDPVHAHTQSEVTVVQLLFDTLYRADPNGGFVPLLARDTPVIVGTTARFQLLEGVTFHDGQVLSPNDVVASLRRAARHRVELAAIRNVSYAGGYLVVELSEANAELVAALAHPAASITPAGQPPGKELVGTGPFAFVRRDDQRGLFALTAHGQYFAGRPYLDGLNLRWFSEKRGAARAYESGHLHLSLAGKTVFSGHQPKYATETLDMTPRALRYVGFCPSRVPLDRHFRQALSLVVNRTALVRVGAGEPVIPVMEPTMPAADKSSESRFQGDLYRAQKALLGAVTKPAQLTLVYDKTRQDDGHVAARLADALYRLGFATTLLADAGLTFVSRVEGGQCDLYLGESAAAQSPWQASVAAFAVPASRAPATLVAAGKTMKQLQREFHRLIPVIPLYYRGLRVHHRSTVRGFGGRNLAVDLANVFAWN